MLVQQEDNGKDGSLFLTDEKGRIAEIFYVYAGTDKLIIDHTEVSPVYEGNGLGKLLVAQLVAFAREQQLKVIPLCPYAAKVFAKTPEYSDVLFHPAQKGE